MNKVLIAESGSGFGGSSRYLSSLLPLLDRRRFAIEIVAYGDGPFIQQIEKEGWTVHHFRRWRFPWGNDVSRTWYLVRCTTQLILLVPFIAFWLLRRRVQLVHVNNEILSHVPLIVAARLAGCHVLCHMHGWRQLTRTERWASGFVHQFVCVTRSGAEFYNAQLNKNVLPVPNGISIQFNSQSDFGERDSVRRSLEVEENACLAVLVGRLIPLKGHPVFFHALARARKTVPGLEGLVVGEDPSGDSNHYQMLQREVKELGLEDAVQFLPWQKNLDSIYAACDVVVQPSVEAESFGYAALEGMCAAKPVLASRIGGLVDVIDHEKTGLLLEPGNPDELASALIRIAQNPVWAQGLGKEGKSRAQNLFAIEENARRIQEIYVSSLSRMPPRDDGRCRILIAESGSGNGGSVGYLADLVEHLDPQEFNIRVLVYGFGRMTQRLKKGVREFFFRPHWRFPWGEDVLSETVGLRSLWVAVRCVIQIAVLAPLIAFWLKWQRINIVHLNNDIRSHLPLLVASRLANCRVLCHFHVWRMLTRPERWFSSWVHQFVSVSKAGAEFFSSQLERKITAVPNGVSLDSAVTNWPTGGANLRKSLGLGENDKLMVIVGRLLPWKGQDIFLEALRKLVQKFPELHGLIVGGDSSADEEYLTRLKAQAASLGIQSHVHFLGWQEEMEAVYAASDLVVHASKRPEPFGLVILEAMFAGKPVIATKGGGVNDLVVDNRTGCLIEPGSVDQLATAIERLIKNPVLAGRLAARAEHHAKSNFTIEKNASRIAVIYRELLTTIPVKSWNVQIKKAIWKTGALHQIRSLVGARVPILMYHKLAEKSDPFFPALPVKAFREQMEFVKSSYRILSLDELMEGWLANGSVPERGLVVTFDDGYASTWALARPILEELKIPVTIFLATDPTESQGFIWTDILRWWIKLTSLKHYGIQVNGFKGEWALETTEERLWAARGILDGLKKMSNDHRKSALVQMASELSVPDDRLPERWLLSLDEIKKLNGQNVKFGAHTLTHSILSRMTLEESKKEIFESKRCLEKALGERVRHFAYPNGEWMDFSKEHEKLVSEAGFDSACTSILGLNDSQTNRYALRRIYSTDEPLANFACRLVGLGS